MTNAATPHATDPLLVKCFKDRVDRAARHISSSQRATRSFDACFEMHDGDYVVTALYRRCKAHPEGKLAQNIRNYLNKESCASTALQFEDISNKDLSIKAAQYAAAERKKTEELMASWASAV